MTVLNTSSLSSIVKKRCFYNIFKSFVSCKKVKCVQLSTSSGIQNNTSSTYHIEPIFSFSHYVNDILLQDAAQYQTNNEVTKINMVDIENNPSFFHYNS